MKQYKYTTSSLVLAFGWVWIWVYLVFHLLDVVLKAPLAVAGVGAALASLSGYLLTGFIPPRFGEILGLTGWILMPLSLLVMI
jgi:hypothetical protein